MTTLQERLTEAMETMGWEHADLMRVSGQSSSVVSQWLGRGSKLIKSIGKHEAAARISAASGYSALWLAKGIGPKFNRNEGGLRVAQQSTSYESPPSAETILEWLGMLLASLPVERRAAFADNLAGFAREGGSDVYRIVLSSLLKDPVWKTAKRK